MICNLLFSLYKINRKNSRRFVLWMLNKIEGGQFRAKTIRKIFYNYHQIEIGMYTHGGCFNPNWIDRYTKIGRYCSIASHVRIINANHPIELKSSHAFFFNPVLGYAREELAEFIPIEIGCDVWIGHGAIILPNVKKIGHGAIISAGAVVNKDVPPYAISVGNPSRIVRYRFPEKEIEFLLNSKWWEKSIEELKQNIEIFQKPFSLSRV